MNKIKTQAAREGGLNPESVGWPRHVGAGETGRGGEIKDPEKACHELWIGHQPFFQKLQ